MFLHHAGRGHVHLHLRHSAANPGRHDTGPQSRGDPGRAVPRERGAAAHTREEVVHGAALHHHARRHSPVRLHLHRDVLHLHVLLGLQNLLRLRFHVTSVCYPHDSHGLRDHCLHVLPSQRGRLQMVSDNFIIYCFILD